MATPNDNVSLGVPVSITTEYVDANATGVRRDPALSTVPYEIPRSKIVIGPYGGDWGDADYDHPLPVRDDLPRRQMELQMIRDAQQTLQGMARSVYETVPLMDQRGAHLAHRGQR